MKIIKLFSGLAVACLQMRTQRKWRHILLCNLNIYMDPLPHGVDTYWPTYPAACPTSMLGKHNAWISPQANVSEYKILENKYVQSQQRMKTETQKKKGCCWKCLENIMPWFPPQANVSENKILENLISNQNKEWKQKHRRNKVAVEKRDWSGSSLLNLLILLFPA